MSEPEQEPTEPTEEPTLPDTPDVTGPADDEAADAEEPEPDDDDDDEAAAATEPEPSTEPESQADRKQMQAATRAVQSYARKIGEIFGEQANELLSCPLCGDTVWPGFVHLADAGKMPNATKDATMSFLGYAREVEYPQSPQHRSCPDCQARGKVSTGSKVPGKENVTCPSCMGAGYIGPAMTTTSGGTPAESSVTGPTMVPSGNGAPDTDPWGDPKLLPDGRENPNYGKMPQYKILIDPWGVTAGLTVQDAATS